jgi:iron complex transport system substrate-binding protein
MATALMTALALVAGACAAGSPASSPGGTGSPAATTAPATPGPGTATPPSAGPVTVTDALGREVAFEVTPTRIVLAGKAVFMVADAVYLFPEAPSRVVGLGQPSQGEGEFIPVVDPGYGGKTILEGGAGPEQIAAANPDVVLAKSSNAESLGGPLEALGVKVVYVDFETPEQYARDLRTLGQLFGNEARARELIAYFEERVERTTTALASLEDARRPNVLLLYYSDKEGAVAFNVPPLEYIQGTMVELAGGRLAWRDAQLGKGWTTVTLEQIAAWDPDQVYVVSYAVDVDDVVATLRADPQWQALRAVRDGQLHGFPGDYHSWDQPDPRWALGLTWLAATIHPDRFAGLDMDKETRSFFRDLYGLADAAYEREIMPHLSGDLP